ncbi:FMRFamide receptor-like [Penaeus monodon]|uniref:FMRFamide receptor-like n=1 Tax=Penaeus monodon TaxID=6687 RepID=UPI0018A7C9D9|nr:FMRFamide receptor-like [Penaeus monodon]
MAAQIQPRQVTKRGWYNPFGDVQQRRGDPKDTEFHLTLFTECDIGEDVRHFFYVATPLRNDNNYKQIYIMWMFLVVMYLVPFISLTVFNSFIYRRVRAANQERQRLSRLEKKEIGLAVMLLVVVTVFFVCNVLAFIINVLELLDIVVPELTATSNVLVCVNSSVNFIIYCIFGQKFRRLFLKMFCGRIVKTSARRDTTFRESRTLTNGRSTQIIRMSSWNGSHRSRSDSQAAAKLDGRHDSASSWRPLSKYSSVPLGDSSTPRTASSSFTPSRSPSLVPRRAPARATTPSEREAPGWLPRRWARGRRRCRRP